MQLVIRSDFGFFNLIFGFQLSVVIKSVELRVHAPEVELVCRSGNGAHLPHLQSLDGIVFEEPFLYHSKIVQRPAIVRITNV